jgi:hypothetical protein
VKPLSEPSFVISTCLTQHYHRHLYNTLEIVLCIFLLGNDFVVGRLIKSFWYEKHLDPRVIVADF